MKKFWLLLLAFVLPLQMSWAAVHFCDDDLSGGGARVVAAVAEGQHGCAAPHGTATHEVAEQSDGQKAQPSSDACCSAAHGCHGLHSLMSERDATIALSATAERLADFKLRLVKPNFVTRLERPQWSAA